MQHNATHNILLKTDVIKKCVAQVIREKTAGATGLLPFPPLSKTHFHYEYASMSCQCCKQDEKAVYVKYNKDISASRPIGSGSMAGRHVFL